MELSLSTQYSDYTLNEYSNTIQPIEKESVSTINLEIIKSKIELMTKNQHIEILKIFKKYPSIKLNENKSGIYINLSFLSPNTIDELKTYLNYIIEQEHSLNVTETVKEDIKKSYFI